MASPELTSLRSPRVTAARRPAKRSSRTKERRFVAEGPQAVREAVDHLVEVYVPPEAAERHADLVAAARAAGVPVLTATEQVLAEVCDTVTPQGVAGICRFLDR